MQGELKPVAWMPIASAPKDGTVILLGLPIIGNLHEEDRRVYEGLWHEGQQKFTSVNGFILLSAATHWMPLPPAPGTSPVVDHPPTTNPVDDRETPVGDHQMVDAVAELQLAAFLAGRGSVTSMKHGTRTAKPCPTMDDFKGMAQAALTAARAQVEGENQRLREALEHYAKDYDYEDKRSQWDGGAIARQAIAAASLRAKGPGQ